MFGIGAYLFQISDTGEEIPIEFLSKSLTLGQDLKWSIPEKEAYAIFYAIKKWDHLLRDVRFVLETDHSSSLKFNRELVLIRVFSGGMADEQVQLFLTAILATLVNEIIDFGMWFAYSELSRH